MKKHFFLIFPVVLLIFSLSAFAEMKGDFSVNSSSATVKEGDLLEGTLKIWPVENPDPADFTNLLNTKLFNALQLIQILSVEPSANNADVLEVKGLFVVHPAKYLTSYDLKYKNETVAIEAPALKIAPLETKAQDFFVLDQSLNLSHYQMYIFAGILLVLFIIALVKRNQLIKWVRGLKKDPKAEAIRLFKDKFQKASSREDFEEIYARKEEWLPLLSARTSAYDEFFNVMNQHQYKPSWGSEELKDVKNIFDIIRGSFK